MRNLKSLSKFRKKLNSIESSISSTSDLGKAILNLIEYFKTEEKEKLITNPELEMSLAKIKKLYQYYLSDDYNDVPVNNSDDKVITSLINVAPEDSLVNIEFQFDDQLEFEKLKLVLLINAKDIYEELNLEFQNHLEKIQLSTQDSVTSRYINNYENILITLEEILATKNLQINSRQSILNNIKVEDIPTRNNEEIDYKLKFIDLAKKLKIYEIIFLLEEIYTTNENIDLAILLGSLNRNKRDYKNCILSEKYFTLANIFALYNLSPKYFERRNR